MITVLAVDDSKTIRDMLRLTLSNAGMKVHVANDGIDGLEALANLTPGVIISDINMPRLDGFGFIEAVRKIDAFQNIPIIVLTTEAAPELRARARAAGATGWIVKPFDPEKLIKALHTVVG